MASSCEDIFGVSPFVRTCMRYLMQTTPRGRQRRESSPPESLCEIYGWSRIQYRRVVRKLQRRVKITPGIGFRVVRLLLQSSESKLLSIDPGTFSDACLLGGGECLHNANNWPIRITTTRSATSLVFAICAIDLRISSTSLPIQVNLCFPRHFRLHSAC